jgi:hypothetical protein
VIVSAMLRFQSTCLSTRVVPPLVTITLLSDAARSPATNWSEYVPGGTETENVPF